MKRGLLAVLLLIALTGGPVLAADPRVLIYPSASRDPDDPRPGYGVDLLTMALAKAGYPAVVRPSGEVFEQSRAFDLVAQRKGLDVVWAATTPERERAMRPVRIPIDRGLLGIRFLLIRADRAGQYEQMRLNRQLGDLVIGQGIGWPDGEILRRAGYTVIDSSYDTLFRLVENGRIDAFPRSIIEARSEMLLHRAAGRDLFIAPGVALDYRSADFFFTSREDEALAQAIERGLRLAYADGSFMARFRQMLEERGLGIGFDIRDRYLVQVANPAVTQETMAIASEFWEFPWYDHCCR